MKNGIIGLVAILAIAGTAQAGIITVDGDLSDWGGVIVANNNGSNVNGYVPPAWVLGFFSEDTNDTSNNYQVGPGYGGQDYDAEFLAVGFDQAENKLLIAIVSGQRADNGFSKFGPGDIRLLSDDLHSYGIEVGGAGIFDADGYVREGNSGSTYTVNGSGYTTAVTNTTVPPGPGQHAAGTLWMDPTWITTGPYAGEKQAQLTGGTYLGTADYIFTRNEVTTQHSIIEMAIDLGAFYDPLHPDRMLTTVSWMPSCGNDVLLVNFDTPLQPHLMPLPSGALLGFAGLALLGAFGYRRRRRAKHELV